MREIAHYEPLLNLSFLSQTYCIIITHPMIEWSNQSHSWNLFDRNLRTGASTSFKFFFHFFRSKEHGKRLGLAQRHVCIFWVSFWVSYLLYVLNLGNKKSFYGGLRNSSSKAFFFIFRVLQHFIGSHSHKNCSLAACVNKFATHRFDLCPFCNYSFILFFSISMSLQMDKQLLLHKVQV